MNGKRILAVLMVAALAAMNVSPVSALGEEQYLVVASNNGFPDDRVQAVQQAGGKIVKVFPQIGLAVATSADPDFPARARGIAGIGSVVPDPVAEVDTDTQLLSAESAEKVSKRIPKGANLVNLQWGLQAIQAPVAWDLGVTGNGVRVAVIDAGILTTHPDLAPNLNLALSTSIVPGESVEFIPGGPVMGNFSHATMVAGLIAAADNGFGTTGVAPDAEVVAIKVLSDRAYSTRVSWIVEGILYAAEIRADVANISMSYGWPKKDPESSAADVAHSVAVRAVNFAHQRGTLLVASGGNTGLDWDGAGSFVRFPRDMPNVLGVAATAPQGCWALDPTTDLDWPAPYTDFGQRVIDLAAPGGKFVGTPLDVVTLEGLTLPACVFDMVLSTSSCFGPARVLEKQGTWNYASGTSLAAPHVAGVAALVIQANAGLLTPAQVRTILEQSADDLGKPGNDDYYGLGRVNAMRAVLQ